MDSADPNSTAKQLLFEIHRNVNELNERVGHHGGVLDELIRHFQELATNFNKHVEDEIAFCPKVDLFREEAKDHMSALSARLAAVEQAVIESRIRWGVIILVGGGICALTGGLLSIMATLGSKSIATWIGHVAGGLGIVN